MWPLEDIAKLVGGTIVGKSDLLISGAAPINRVQSGQLTFVSNADYLEKFESGPGAVALVPRNLRSSVKPTLQVDHPEEAFAQIITTLVRPPIRQLWQDQRGQQGQRDHQQRQISPLAHISPTALIEDDVSIHPGVVVMDGVTIGSGTTIFPNVTLMENCKIGRNVTLFPGVVCYENTEIGDRVILHANVVIGAYGFGYQQIEGRHRLAPQLGYVRIEADVEIGANSTIDRGTYDATTIGQGSKLDNLVMIGHNCQIGAHNLLCSQVGIAGSCQTGDYVVMGGQVGLADHLNIGHQVAIGAQSGLMHDVPDKQQVFGSPARPFREQMQILAGLPRIPDTRRAVRELEKQVARLQLQLEESKVAASLDPSPSTEGSNEPTAAQPAERTLATTSESGSSGITEPTADSVPATENRQPPPSSQVHSAA